MKIISQGKNKLVSSRSATYLAPEGAPAVRPNRAWSNYFESVTGGKGYEAIPAALKAVTLITETIAAMPLDLLSVDGDKPSEKLDAYQEGSEARLLRFSPSPDQTGAEFWQVVILEMITNGGALIYKSFNRHNKVIRLDILDSSDLQVTTENGEVVYYLKGLGTRERLDKAKVLYIPNRLKGGNPQGFSPVALSRNTIREIIELSTFSRNFYGRAALPSGVVTLQGAREEEVKAFKREWETKAEGSGNSGFTMFSNGDVKFTGAAGSLRDQQFAELKEMNVADVARIFNMPYDLLAGESVQLDSEEQSNRFLTLTLQPYITRIEQRLGTDQHLCIGSKPKFRTGHVQRANLTARFGGYTQARQAGWITINEIREAEGLPPVEGGDTIQQTPVGGAPNQLADTTGNV